MKGDGPPRSSSSRITRSPLRRMSTAKLSRPWGIIVPTSARKRRRVIEEELPARGDVQLT
eukprot:14093071-Heterocapsa_arctica.AAC.1